MIKLDVKIHLNIDSFVLFCVSATNLLNKSFNSKLTISRQNFIRQAQTFHCIRVLA